MLQVNCLLRAWFSISIANPPTTTNQIKLTNVGKIYAISMIFLIVRPLLIRVANIAMSGAHPNHHPPIILISIYSKYSYSECFQRI